MTRVKRGTVTKRRHARLLKQTKGFWGQRKNVYRRAHETLTRAMAYSYAGRKQEKRTMRSLFISRIKAAVEAYDLQYSRFIHALQTAQVTLNRKMLSQIAIFDQQAFAAIVAVAKNS